MCYDCFILKQLTYLINLKKKRWKWYWRAFLRRIAIFFPTRPFHMWNLCGIWTWFVFNLWKGWLRLYDLVIDSTYSWDRCVLFRDTRSQHDLRRYSSKPKLTTPIRAMQRSLDHNTEDSTQRDSNSIKRNSNMSYSILED